MKTIIRIEHINDGFGIWKSRGFNNNLNDRVYYDLSFYDDLIVKHRYLNTPEEDGLNKFVEGEWFCAFKSLEQIKEWIECPWFKELVEKGFQILILEVSEYQEGNHQIIYTKKSIASSKDISSLFV
jgi:hypothetical protein